MEGKHASKQVKPRRANRDGSKAGRKEKVKIMGTFKRLVNTKGKQVYKK